MSEVYAVPLELLNLQHKVKEFFDRWVKDIKSGVQHDYVKRLEEFERMQKEVKEFAEKHGRA